MAKLRDIATVLSGATPNPALGGEARYVRLGDVGEAGIGEDWGTVSPEPSKGRDGRLREGDIVLRGKGREFAAGLVGGEHAGAYAVADLYVIRPDPDRVRADYLLGVLRSPELQNATMASAQGSALARIPREALADLEVPCPRASLQAQIGALTILVEAEAKLTNQLLRLRAQLHSELLQQCLGKARAEDGHPRGGLQPGPPEAFQPARLSTSEKKD